MSIMLRRLLVIFVLTILVLTIFASAVPHTRDLEESYMMIPDKETGARVAQWTKEMNINPEELGSYYQGDIMLTKNTQRSGLTDTNSRWPNCVVPYLIKGDFDADQLDLINRAIDQYYTKTGIRFKKRSNENDYIVITSDDTGCHSNVGRQGGEQTVNLQRPGCVTLIGTVEHEFMHALGCWHEHTREDRDDYVYINKTNIQPQAQRNFQKDISGTSSYYGVKYNCQSIMHYGRTAFAINPRQDTITPKDPNAKIGQREGFSEGDLQLINNMYNCKYS